MKQRVEVTTGPIQHIAEKKPIFRGNRIVETGAPIVFVGNGAVELGIETRAGRKSGAGQNFGLRRRVEGEGIADSLSGRQVGVLSHRYVSSGGVRHEEIMGEGIGNCRHVAHRLVGPESFIVDKEERLVLFDRPAKGATELILTIGRDTGAIEKVARFDRAVAQEFVGGTVILVGAALRGGVNYGAGAPVFRRISIGERLELIDRIHAQRSAERSRSAAVLKVARGVRPVQQKQSSGGAHAGDGEIRLIAEQRVGLEIRQSNHAGRERNQLRIVSSVQREFAHLRLIDKTGHAKK